MTPHPNPRRSASPPRRKPVRKTVGIALLATATVLASTASAIAGPTTTGAAAGPATAGSAAGATAAAAQTGAIVRAVRDDTPGRPPVARRRRSRLRDGRRERAVPGQRLAHPRRDGRVLDPADQAARRALVRPGRQLARQGRRRREVHQRPRLQPDRLLRFRRRPSYRLRPRRRPRDAGRPDAQLEYGEDGQAGRGRALRADAVLPVGLDRTRCGRREPPGHGRVRRRCTPLPGAGHTVVPQRDRPRLRRVRRIVPASDGPRTRPEPPRSPGPGGDLPRRRDDARAV